MNTTKRKVEEVDGGEIIIDAKRTQINRLGTGEPIGAVTAAHGEEEEEGEIPEEEPTAQPEDDVDDQESNKSSLKSRKKDVKRGQRDELSGQHFAFPGLDNEDDFGGSHEQDEGTVDALAYLRSVR